MSPKQSRAYAGAWRTMTSAIVRRSASHAVLDALRPRLNMGRGAEREER